MNRYPTYVIIEDIKYNINTDFRYALKCEEISKDNSLNVYEKMLAIICTLFGENSLDKTEHYEKLYIAAKKFLLCGKERQHEDKKPDMDFKQDYDLIEASFTSDYGIDLENTEMHWWKFSNLMNGLSNSEFGDCCVLNRVRNLRNIDTSTIKDAKLRQEIEAQQKQWALQEYKQKKEFTEEEKNNINSFYDLMEGSE